ncbi:hypothetical protein AAVH_29494 [Aphelenchoides avenae]|nr:hypothetical protein AAVH_29494 [Aphelenchus avenae]
MPHSTDGASTCDSTDEERVPATRPTTKRVPATRPTTKRVPATRPTTKRVPATRPTTPVPATRPTKRVPTTTKKQPLCAKNMFVRNNKCECSKGFEWENGQKNRCRRSCDKESQEWNVVQGRCMCRHGYVEAPGGACSKKSHRPKTYTIIGGIKTDDVHAKHEDSKVLQPLDPTIPSSTLTATEGTSSTTSPTWHIPVVQGTTQAYQEGATSKRWHVPVTEDTTEVTSSTTSQTSHVPVVEDTTPTPQARTTSQRWHVPVTEDTIATTSQSSTGSFEPNLSSDILDYKVLPPHRASKASARGRMCLPLFLTVGHFLVLQ